MTRIISYLLFSLLSFDNIAQEVSIDHIITLIPQEHYESVVRSYQNVGFTVKSGRPHENGLLNKHIKFSDNSALELMTLNSKPSDQISRAYSELMTNAERAVYVALRINSAKDISKALTSGGIDNSIVENKLWNYVTFQEKTALSTIFLIEMKTKVEDAAYVTNHENKATGISEVFIYSESRLSNLLGQLGLPKKVKSYPDFGECTVYSTSNGDLVLLKGDEYSTSRIARVIVINKEGVPVFRRDYR